MSEEKEMEVNAEDVEKLSEVMSDSGFKRGFIRGISGALFCIMYHETCSAEDAMDILHIKEDQRDWYRPFLKENIGENWGAAVAIRNMDNTRKAILADADKNIKAVLPALLKAISVGTPLEDAGMEDFFNIIAELQASHSLGASVELEQYCDMLSEIKNATEALPTSERLFNEIEEKYCLKL